jgi:putative endonuclease
VRGEELAARHLESRGYTIVARNYRCAHGEIDLIAAQGEYLVFVEVKTRRGRTDYHPLLAVNARKMEKLRTLGSLYLAEHPELELQPRFDVIAVVLRAPRPEVEHIENAF